MVPLGDILFILVIYSDTSINYYWDLYAWVESIYLN